MGKLITNIQQNVNNMNERPTVSFASSVMNPGETGLASILPGNLTREMGDQQLSRIQAARASILPAQSGHYSTSEADVMSTNLFPLPDAITVQATSAAGGGAVATRVFLLQQDLLQNVTDNGSGAGSITYNYTDGFGGKVISQLIALARAGVGAICYGVSIRFEIASTGAGLPSALSVSNPFFATNNAFGQATPLNFNTTSDQTRGDFDTSIEVIPCRGNLTRITQFALTLQPDSVATVTFYFVDKFKR